MITSYEIKKVDNEEVLILYFNYKFEFAKNNSNDESFLDKINHFLTSNKVKFKGTKAVLVVGTLVFGSIVLIPSKHSNNQTTAFNYISQIIINEYDPDGALESYYKIKGNVENHEKEKQFEAKTEKIQEETIKDKPSNATIKKPKQDTTENNQSSTADTKVDDNEDKQTIVTVYRSNGNVINLELEEYVIGVVAKEMPASFHIEALKAQAIISRTYALRLISQDKILTDTVSTQAYIDINEMKSMWQNEFDNYYDKIKSAVMDTKGVVLTYNGEYAYSLYHSTSNGYTESSLNVFGYDYPYLQTVESKWDLVASSYEREKTIDFKTLSNYLGFDFNTNSIIELKRNNYGRVERVSVDNHYYTGIEFRNLLGLRSTDFDIVNNDGFITVTTKGYGHGVGLSQYGANGMAKVGYKYPDILKYYYKNITIDSIK